MKKTTRQSRSGDSKASSSPLTATKSKSSAGNSPASSPTVSRKDVTPSSKLTKTHSTVADNLDDTLHVDVLETTTVITQTVSKLSELTNCPCTMFDRNCLGIKCSKCDKSWHTECCNLAGITQTVARKLEGRKWECPWCYLPAIPNPDSKDGKETTESLKAFMANISRVQACTEELKEGVTTVEFFRQHIQHLLLDKDKFITHSERISELFDDVKIIKDEIKEMSLKRAQEMSEHEDLKSRIDPNMSLDHSAGFNTIKEEIIQLREQMNTFISKPGKDISPELNESLSKISKFPIEELSRMGENVAAFSEKISEMQQSMTGNITRSNETSTAGAMQPNTVSPHMRGKKKKKEDICKPFTSYKDEAVSPELKDSLLDFVGDTERTFKTIGSGSSRDVLYYGDFGYRYSGGEHKAQPIPEVIKTLIELVKPHLPNPEATLNSCLISRYSTGTNCIPPHRDDEAVIDPESDIITVSIGAERTMTFANNNGDAAEQQVLKDRSVIVSSRFAQDFWVHGIDPCESAEIRYSFTLRHISPHFINSTIILGDSNTTNINFGNGVGKLGVWMPGKRVKVGHIDAIPDPENIGPYRNIVIHTGINSINCSPKYRKSNRALINGLEEKIKQICEMYPKAKVYISLLLPTRLTPLNHRVHDFNNLIMDMTCRMSRVCIIEHSLFGDRLTDEHGRWKKESESSSVYTPKTEDTLHLGKSGIRIFAMNLKKTVLGKSKSESTTRFNGGRGSYRRALEGNGSRRRSGGSTQNSPTHDGYQP